MKRIDFKKLLPALVLLISFVAISLVLYQHTQQPDSTEDGKIQVVTSIYPLFFLAQEIGGENVAVQLITPPGTEPHEYEPTVKDVAKIEDSQLLIINGKLEDWTERVSSQLNSQQTQVLVTNNSSSADPHTWLNLELFQAEAEKVALALATLDPDHEQDYRARALTLQQELADLDQAYQLGLQQCQHRKFVTAHNAFGHLAEQYQLTQIAIAGISPEEEPTAKRLVEITNQITENGLEYIFFESNVSSELSNVLATEAGIKTLVLNPIESIPQVRLDQGETYITVMQSNLTNLRTALACQ